ncbi:YusW family protein [Sporosarcina obsidiansis]|uniref:YusW family protein n=1 Tax=Sporosarcina obsidiansis TaxID=2660748 RepID=UPI00129AE166|nr:YusW family protein [Sporosarcina obsidiansis]
MSLLRLVSVVGFSSILVLSGCSSKEKPPNNDEPALGYEDEDKGSSINTGNGYGFTDFDLSIKKDGKKIEADYEDVKPSDTEYVNEFQNVNLEGNEAMDDLHKMFMEILLDSDTSKEEAIDKILKWYGLDDYDEFELEVKYTDDKTLTIDEKK